MNKVRNISEEEIEKVLLQAEKVRPHNAKKVITKAQIIMGIVALLAFWGIVGDERLPVIIGICVLGFTAQFALKTYLTLGSLDNLIQVGDVSHLTDSDLPMYTILVPLRGEEAVVHKLVASLAAIDYPQNRLQIILILEKDDPNTWWAVRSMQLPPNFEVLILAAFGPKTKPKACTVALTYARGVFCVVYDAEDIPQPDQLKKVVQAYAERSEENIWCIQAKLQYNNASQNVLTRLFSGEYITYFNLVLPALGKQNLLVPLGGTSNHFRTERLRQMAGWDVYNVTEDLDLGVEIKRRKGQVKVIDSVTWEVATSQLRLFKKGGWTAQRSRWLKGHPQTYLTHMRNPPKLLWDLGVTNFLLFQVWMLGSFLALLLTPIFLGFSGVYLASRTILVGISPELALSVQYGIEAMFIPSIFYLAVGSFVIGNLGLMYYNMLGCLLREEYSSVKYMFLVPFYWLLMSFAAWKALYQLITKPHHWEKTSHAHHQEAEPQAVEVLEVESQESAIPEGKVGIRAIK